MAKREEQTTVKAVRTNDGFIEILGVDAMDAIGGGFVDPESIFCELQESDEPLLKESF